MVNIKSQLQLRQKKERQTPEARKKFGFIERHKDYKLRAENYKEHKQRRLELTKAAENKNPNEYHFGMEKYQQGGFFGVQEVKDPLSHANDSIPDVNLHAARSKLQRQIEGLKVHLYDAYGNKNAETAQEIEKLNAQVTEISDELQRRIDVQLVRSGRKTQKIWNEKTERYETRVLPVRRK